MGFTISISSLDCLPSDTDLATWQLIMAVTTHHSTQIFMAIEYGSYTGHSEGQYDIGKQVGREHGRRQVGQDNCMTGEIKKYRCGGYLRIHYLLGFAEPMYQGVSDPSP